MRKYILLAFFLCLFSGVSLAQQNCKFDRGAEPKIPEANTRVEMTAGIVRKVAGIIWRPEKSGAAKGAIVAVYKLSDNREIFIGWQTADKDGKFCFGKLADGKYLIRAGLKGGFNSTRVYLTLDSYNPVYWKKKIEIELTLGT